MSALAVTLGAVALLLDAEPLWVPAVAMLGLALGAGGWVRLSAARISVTRRLGARQVIEGEPVRLDLDVRAGGLPFPGGRLEDPLLDAPIALVAGRQSVHAGGMVRFARRGVRHLQPPQAIVTDALGLAVVVVAARTAPDEILVLPRIEPVAAPPGGDHAGRVQAGQVGVAAAMDLDGVAEYREGTPASRIYWPSLARGAGMSERRFSPDGDGRPLVVLDPRAPASDDDLDAAVRAAASLCVHLAKSGGCWVLLPGQRRAQALESSMGGWAQLHARLAVLGADGAPPLTDLVGRRGAVVLVSARRRTRPSLGQGGASARVLVVPGELPGRRPSFAVAGCSGYTLGRPARAGGAGGRSKRAA